MLSIRSLTADLVSDPALLFNNAELSRIPWKKGPNNRDIIVEVNGSESDHEVIDIHSEVVHNDRDGSYASDTSSIDKSSRLTLPA